MESLAVGIVRFCSFVVRSTVMLLGSRVVITEVAGLHMRRCSPVTVSCLDIRNFDFHSGHQARKLEQSGMEERSQI